MALVKPGCKPPSPRFVEQMPDMNNVLTLLWLVIRLNVLQVVWRKWILTVPNCTAIAQVTLSTRGSNFRYNLTNWLFFKTWKKYLTLMWYLAFFLLFPLFCWEEEQTLYEISLLHTPVVLIPCCKITQTFWWPKLENKLCGSPTQWKCSKLSWLYWTTV